MSLLSIKLPFVFREGFFLRWSEVRTKIQGLFRRLAQACKRKTYGWQCVAYWRHPSDGTTKDVALADCQISTPDMTKPGTRSVSGRNGAYKWLTEQNMRENYLKVFEIAVKVGEANAMMSSVDRIGGTRAAGSWAMLTGVLRNEWGFRGTVITDYYQNAGASRPTDTVHDVDECVRAGNSQLLFKDNNPGIGWFNDSTSNTAKASIYKSAKDILYAYADTLNYHATANELTKDSVIGTIDKPFPWWVILLGFIDLTALVGLGFASGLSIRGYVRSKKSDAEAEHAAE